MCLVLAGCGKEVGRVPLAKGGEAGSATVALDGSKDVQLWTDLDVEYDRDVAIRYEVEVREGGKAVATTKCDAFDVNTKMMAREVHNAKRNAVAYQGKMKCSVKVPKSGNYDVHAKLVVTPKPKKLAKAGLVIKQ